MKSKGKIKTGKFHEHPGHEPLDKHLNLQRFSMENFLTIALATNNGTDKLHEKNIIHKYINPYSILLNSSTGSVKIDASGISDAGKHKSGIEEDRNEYSKNF